MSDRDRQARADLPQYPAPPVGLPLGELLRVLRRRLWVILWVVGVITVIATLAGLLKSETYTATALVMIQPQGSAIPGLEQARQGSSADATDIETQIRFIRSHENLARTVDRLGLDENPSLIRAEDEQSVLTSLLPSGLAKAPDNGAEEDSKSLREQAVAALHNGLDVAQSGRSSMLAISYTAPDPVKAARLADGVAKAYVEGQLEQKLANVKRARSWLGDRVENLRLGVMEAERAIEEYRAAHDLYGGEGTTPDSQQIAALTTQQIDARAERTAKQSKLRRVRELRDAGDYELLASTLSSPLLMDLRQRELELARREAELSQEYGEQHPRIQQLEAEKAGITERIGLEIDNAIRGLETEIEMARSREEAFRQSLAEAKGEAKGHSALTGQAQVALRELERKASAERSLYENFLVRLKETEAQQEIIRPDARIVSPAEVPGAPSSPSPMVFAFVGFTGSLVLGSILAVLLEQLDTSLRSGRQLESLLGVRSLGLVPAVTENDASLHDYFASKPDSAYAEGVRSVYTQIRWAQAESPPKVILVTSALPGEGKTSLAGSLAMCAAQVQQRALLVDLDLRRPAIAERFGLESDAGILELLADDVYFEDVAQSDPHTGIDILAAAERTKSPSGLLTSNRLQRLLQEARERYDLIVVDTTPVLGIADAKMLASSVDAVVFVIRWERTKRDAARSALEELADVADNVVGAVLNNVDMKRHAYYAYGDSGQYYLKYSRYYQN